MVAVFQCSIESAEYFKHGSTQFAVANRLKGLVGKA